VQIILFICHCEEFCSHCAKKTLMFLGKKLPWKSRKGHCGWIKGPFKLSVSFLGAPLDK